MKKKGITIWEQHIEHIVLGVAVLFLLGFGAWQFLRSPNEVNGVAPDEVDPQLEALAERVNDRLRADTSSSVQVPAYAPRASDFMASIQDSVSPVDRLAAVQPSVNLGDATSADTSGGATYVTLDLPPATSIVVQTDQDSLVPEVVSANDELAARFPSRPYDIFWQTIGFVVPLDGIREQFQQPGDDANAAIPESWYGGRIEVIDVRIERQRQTPDGWTDAELVPTLPGAFTFRDDLGEQTRETRDMISRAFLNPATQSAILRPEFLATVNQTWTAPNPLVAPIDDEILDQMTDEERRIRRIEEQLSKHLAERARLVALLVESGGSDPGPPPSPGDEEEDEEDEEEPPSGASPGGPPGVPGAGGDGRRSGGGGGGRRAPGIGSPMGGDGGAGEQDDSERRLERLEQRIEQLDRRILTTKQRLIDRGVDPDGVVEPMVEDEAVVGDILGADQVVGWGFDIDVQPGDVYRYRVIIDVYNPFFRRKLDLDESQHELADSLTHATMASDWSEPAEVPPPTNFFVTSAQTGDGSLGMGEADVEVYRFYDGRWWGERFALEPGERIGAIERTRNAGPGAPAEIDYTTDWYILDVQRSLDASPSDIEEGLGGAVLVQRVDDDGQVVRIDPRIDAERRQRDELRRKVEEAEDAAQALSRADP